MKIIFIKRLIKENHAVKLNKYITTFDYIDKILIVLSATSNGVSILSFTSIIGAPVGIASASLTLIFSLLTGIIKKLLNITRNKKKKHDKILMLAKSKFNSIETLISQALIDLDRSHEEFIRILKEKDKYERMKENLRSENEEYKIMRLSSIKSKTQKIKNKKKLFFGGEEGWMEYNIRMLEITIDNCYKYDLETINEYIWINRRDFEIETKLKWQVIFDKYKDLSTQKYRKKINTKYYISTKQNIC